LRYIVFLLFALSFVDAQTSAELNATFRATDLLPQLAKLFRKYHPLYVPSDEKEYNLTMELENYARNPDKGDYPILRHLRKEIFEQIIITATGQTEEGKEFVEYVLKMLKNEPILDADSAKMIQNIVTVYTKGKEQYEKL
ncbi:hypothetical protein PFISCL1PPCAC_5314, partial [Pristionchus fissidentatus]